MLERNGCNTRIIPKISKKETEERKNIFDYAKASIEFEGLRLSAEEIDHNHKYISGKINFEEYMNGE